METAPSRTVEPRLEGHPFLTPQCRPLHEAKSPLISHSCLEKSCVQEAVRLDSQVILHALITVKKDEKRSLLHPDYIKYCDRDNNVDANNKNSYHFLSAYYISGTINTLYKIILPVSS